MFRAKFIRLGKKTNFKGFSEETILLSDITSLENGKIVADHIWFGYTKTFQSVELRPGVGVEFEARVKQYTKGYVNKKYGINQRELDYKLSHPTKVKLVDKPANLSFKESP